MLFVITTLKWTRAVHKSVRGLITDLAQSGPTGHECRKVLLPMVYIAWYSLHGMHTPVALCQLSEATILLRVNHAECLQNCIQLHSALYHSLHRKTLQRLNSLVPYRLQIRILLDNLVVQGENSVVDSVRDFVGDSVGDFVGTRRRSFGGHLNRAELGNPKWAIQEASMQI